VERAHRRRDVRKSRHHDDRELRAANVETAAKRDAIHFRHLKVRDHEVGWILADHPKSLSGALS
jgi:hypothetical protein